MKLLGGIGLALGLSTGCSLPLTPELIAALANDNASFCAQAGVSGGAGAATLVPPVPVGGWGSVDLRFCRSNHPDATVTLAPDGTIEIKHGPGKPE